MEDIREQLMRKAHLYVDASAYRAGVDAALTALSQQRAAEDPAVHVPAAPGPPAQAQVDHPAEETATVLALNR